VFTPDNNGATAASFWSAISLAGSFIRYAFYFWAAIVMGMIALVAIKFWGHRVTLVAEKPAFRIADGSVARLPVSTDVIAGKSFGRVEVMQYGVLENRETDLTVIMTLPPQDTPNTTVLTEGLRGTRLYRNVIPIPLSTHYDLETRYGPIHAVDARIETDGRWKQCLSFSSRFRTKTVWLSGWTCDATGTSPGAYALACALDKLVIDKPLASAEADAYMRERMARPADCSANNVSQTFDVRSRPVSPPSRWSQPSSRTRL
jgi:hypothetical protein